MDATFYIEWIRALLSLIKQMDARATNNNRPTKKVNNSKNNMGARPRISEREASTHYSKNLKTTTTYRRPDGKMGQMEQVDQQSHHSLIGKLK